MKTLTEIVSNRTVLSTDELAIASAVKELAAWASNHQEVLMNSIAI